MARSSYAMQRLAEIAAESGGISRPAPCESPPRKRESDAVSLADRRLASCLLTRPEFEALYQECKGQCRLCGRIVRSLIPGRFDQQTNRRGPGAKVAQVVRLPGGLTLVCRACYTGLRIFDLDADRLREAAELVSR